MKKLLFLCFVFVLPFYGCKKDDDKDSKQSKNSTKPLSSKGLLISKEWTTVKIYNGGIDVTDQLSTSTYNFKSNGEYTTTSNSGSMNGTWILDDTVLKLNDSYWDVLELKTNSLKIETTGIKLYLK